MSVLWNLELEYISRRRKCLVVITRRGWRVDSGERIGDSGQWNCQLSTVTCQLNEYSE